ncbi:NAD(P)-dependent oxidoreductase [Lysinibacillus sp. 2017]|uniref:SDR family oxidoreductase n=1 Tax=unclassified Lysinibacillus TaxID=2636778 RepID=UPI000D52972D|nr:MULTISPECIES: sugar nucleotide-binding protein [unclassified Lysinibacillus]AWE07356.1 NAD(P)-dependent oxidoreductase [Lysinibacillus sp. 2017]TGN36517.1 NAD-dependent epimerase/dehydratase family protein [Lysinibacillus sp. S2017]
MKYLVLGATGMAGHTIALYLLENGHEVITYSRSPFSYGDNVNGDLTDGAFLKSLLLDLDYDIVINCIGVLNDACDKAPSNAVFFNSYLPHAIVEILKADEHKKLFHMSTDCVFSGKKAPYYEHSLRDGETFYDRTKALGEIENERHLTFRNSIIGPDMKEDGIGLFNWFMKQNGTIHGYKEAIWTGVTTLTLAKAMERAGSEGLCGLYNLVNNASINKFDLLTLFNQHFKDEKIIILPDSKVKLDKTLINQRQDFKFKVPSYEQMIIEMKDWIESHHNLYAHYFI